MIVYGVSRHTAKKDTLFTVFPLDLDPEADKLWRVCTEPSFSVSMASLPELAAELQRRGAQNVVIEWPMALKPHARAEHQEAVEWAANRLQFAIASVGIVAHPCTLEHAQRAIRVILGTAHQRDQKVKAALQAHVDGWPTQSSAAERSAAVLAMMWGRLRGTL